MKCALVAAGVSPAVEPGVPPGGGRAWTGEAGSEPGRRDAALYGRRDARRYGSRGSCPAVGVLGRVRRVVNPGGGTPPSTAGGTPAATGAGHRARRQEGLDG